MRIILSPAKKMNEVPKPLLRPRFRSFLPEAEVILSGCSP